MTGKQLYASVNAAVHCSVSICVFLYDAVMCFYLAGAGSIEMCLMKANQLKFTTWAGLKRAGWTGVIVCVRVCDVACNRCCFVIENPGLLRRDDLIRFAMLTGSDYTPGVHGVGKVNAAEILRAFPGKGYEICC